MSKVLNEYFSSVFTVEKDMKAWERGEVGGDILGTIHITIEVVLEVLECMKVEKSPDPDQIYARTLQEAREETAGALADVFASSLAIRSWKTGGQQIFCRYSRRAAKKNLGIID
eukprot:g17144.t1